MEEIDWLAEVNVNVDGVHPQINEHIKRVWARQIKFRFSFDIEMSNSFGEIIWVLFAMFYLIVLKLILPGRIVSFSKRAEN